MQEVYLLHLLHLNLQLYADSLNLNNETDSFPISSGGV